MDLNDSANMDASMASTDIVSTGDRGATPEEKTEIAGKENRAVKWSRAAVIVVLLLCGTIMGGIAFMVGRRHENEACFNEFDNLASEIVSLSQEKVLRVFDVLGSLSVTMTSFAKQDGAENAGYPDGFMTLPDLEQHFGTARNVSQAFVLSYLPQVSEEDRDLWEAYSVDHQNWILESNNLNSDGDLMPIPESIWYYESKNGRRRLESGGCSGSARRLKEKHPKVEPKGTGPYSPVWLLSPPPSADDTFITNYNMMDKPVFDKAVKFIEYTRKPTFLDVCTQTAWFGAEDPVQGDHPQTVVVQPVFKEFDHQSKIFGHLAAVIPWNVFFDDILNSASEPVRIVMSNTCDETFSYEIRGTKSIFLGEIDAHNPSFDDRAVHATFAEFANPETLVGGEHCVYTISVYPTMEMVEAYQTAQPLVYVAVVLSIFIFTAAVFIIYDWLVGRRQEVVLSTATKTQALVSSLFPKQVQDRILNQAEDKGAKMVTRTAEFLRQQKEESGGVDAFKKSAPIADNFAETTIMFADIVGFTKWSSQRSPEEVFTLLEAVYYEFDRMAKRRHVFKVETIGDCYVAACGIPESEPNHHIIMASFASACLAKMSKVTKELETSLGVGTTELTLRIGLHSGSCTAGVLRGDRARFQLFGDTMNYASRMESTGIPGKIQISKETADLISASGKAEWIIPREEKVYAKGKGELSTFFLNTSDESLRSAPTKANLQSFSGKLSKASTHSCSSTGSTSVY